MVPVRQTAQHYVGPTDVGRNRQAGLDPVKKRNIALGQGRTGFDPCIHFDRRASLRRMSWRPRRALVSAPANCAGQKTPSQRYPVSDGRLHSVLRFAEWSSHRQSNENEMDQRACVLVGERGFEPPTSSSRTKRATELRYSPKLEKSIMHDGGFGQISFEARVVVLVRPRKRPHGRWYADYRSTLTAVSPDIYAHKRSAGHWFKRSPGARCLAYALRPPALGYASANSCSEASSASASARLAGLSSRAMMRCSVEMARVSPSLAILSAISSRLSW